MLKLSVMCFKKMRKGEDLIVR